MSSSKFYDVLIIGGGIIGTATALSILQKQKLSLLLIEAENDLAAHQTGNNSGVIHSGIYYKPNSLKAQNCVRGREMMYQYCKENNIAFDKCGKLIVAIDEKEISKLNELEQRGIANGIKNIKHIKKDELKDYEPYCDGIEGLFVPETGIVDYKEVTNSFAAKVNSLNGVIQKGCRFLSVKQNKNNLFVETTNGEIECKFLINCGGLHSDEIAQKCGIKKEVIIVPFRGEYYKLKKEKEYLVRNLIYPVPDPNFPFLGVHFTRMIKGGVEAGPNAVLAFKKEGYNKTDFSFQDTLRTFTFSGFWKMVSKYYKMGFDEYYRSFSKRAFTKSLQKLVPEISINDIEPSGSGVRAQALDKKGKLIDDFVIYETEKMIHILNAPSPAATASLSIGEIIADKLFQHQI